MGHENPFIPTLLPETFRYKISIVKDTILSSILTAQFFNIIQIIKKAISFLFSSTLAVSINSRTRLKEKLFFSICASHSRSASASECFCLISLAVDEPTIEAVHAVRKYIRGQYTCTPRTRVYVYPSLEHVRRGKRNKAIGGTWIEESMNQRGATNGRDTYTPISFFLFASPRFDKFSFRCIFER